MGKLQNLLLAGLLAGACLGPVAASDAHLLLSPHAIEPAPAEGKSHAHIPLDQAVVGTLREVVPRLWRTVSVRP